MIPFLRKSIYKSGDFIGEYQIIKLIGEGRFGVCYLVTLNNKHYVMKKLKPKAVKKSKDKLFFEEKILKCVNHASIPKIIDTIKDNNIYAYVLEYKSGKTIEEMIFGDRHKFTYAEIYKIGIKIIEIIKYLHERNIVHRDIRVPNVIVNEEEVYLIDFGLSRFANNERYRFCEDFMYLGHLLLHLYYSSFTKTNKKSKPWYEELKLSKDELNFLKKLLEMKENYKSIYDLECDFINIYSLAESLKS